MQAIKNLNCESVSRPGAIVKMFAGGQVSAFPVQAINMINLINHEDILTYYDDVW
jgi:hypothetical protein